MQNSKTFRLFISSTFNDFRREREVLQAKVFPIVKEYCSSMGYAFQPIDLRWGITDEAQLDQKTLELCLDEVCSCKSYPHPNFLLMLGDRYGWVPLPYIIESQEFDEILNYVDVEEKEVLFEWYREDLNQLPPSYILKERTEKYVDYDIWGEVEHSIRTIFQRTVKQTSLSTAQYRKYFLSATEAEIQEGIIPYLGLTKFQQILLEKNSRLEKIDHEHVFGFFREVFSPRKYSDMFIAQDQKKVLKLKERVKAVLSQKNTLSLKTTQVDEKTLDDTYLSIFEENVISFLKQQVDKQIQQEDHFTEIELEKHAQAYFAEQKRQNFLGQEKSRKKIAAYICNDDTRPMILHGASGKGKSALMAQAIKDIEQTGERDKKVLFCFVGATPNSSSAKAILTAFFAELGKDVRSVKDRMQSSIENSLYISDPDSETLNDFSERIHEEIIQIKENVIIFIDAIDQLTHDDQFIWLPNLLPKNVKIIISVLEDLKYEDTQDCYKAIRRKSDNTHKIHDFDKPLELLESLLTQENRQVQAHQKRYFLQQYVKVNSPLYVVVAAQEMKHWRSYNQAGDINRKVEEPPCSLADTQEDIIEEFIKNLSRLYHHEEVLVEKVLGYLYASKNGLSEYELLELISTDKNFVEKVAPDTWHENKTQDLPVVIWTRLYSQLRPFLSVKNKNGEELLYFFHREFQKVISNLNKIEEEHKAIVQAAYTVIRQQQNVDFLRNRWGVLLITIEQEYIFHKYDSSWLNITAEFNLGRMENQSWMKKYMLISLNDAYHYYQIKYYEKSMRYFYFLKNLLDRLFAKNSDIWIEELLMLRNNLAQVYADIPIAEEAVPLLEENIIRFASDTSYRYKYKKIYILALAGLFGLLRKTDKERAEYYLDEYMKAVDDFYEKDSDIWIENKLNVLMLFGTLQNENSLVHMGKALEMIYPLFERYPEKWRNDFTRILYYISILMHVSNDVPGAISYLEIFFNETVPYVKEYDEFYKRAISGKILLQKLYTESKHEDLIMTIEDNLTFFKNIFEMHPDDWIGDYLDLLGNSAKVFANLDVFKVIELKQQSLHILEQYCIKDPLYWQPQYDKIEKELIQTRKSIKRNDPCPCGSEKKYKKCCSKN